MPWLTLSALPILTSSPNNVPLQISNEHVYVIFLYLALERFHKAGLPLGAEQRIDESPAEGFAGTSLEILEKEHDLLEGLLDSKRFVEVGISERLTKQCIEIRAELRDSLIPFLDTLRPDAKKYSFRQKIDRSRRQRSERDDVFLERYADQFYKFAVCMKSISRLLATLRKEHPYVTQVKANPNWHNDSDGLP